MAELLWRKSETPFAASRFSSGLVRGGVHLLGFGFDGTACFRKGAWAGPEAIRAASPHIETYSPLQDRDLEDYSTIFDLGNLPVAVKETPQKAWQDAVDFFTSACGSLSLSGENIRLLTLGGEHSVSLAPIARYLTEYDDLVVLHLDAHADLRDGYEGFHYSHASIIRRVAERMGDGHRLIQFGIRSGTREEYRWMREHNTLIGSLDLFLERIDSLSSGRPLYLTLDVDFFDPAFMPGTGTPEPGGEDFQSFRRLLAVLAGKRLVGADVVELAPEIDPTGNSAVATAVIVRELILAMM